MIKLDKKIKVGDNYIHLNVSDGYCTEVVIIEKAFFKGNELDKIITFSIWDDIQFRAWSVTDEYENTEKLSFKITVKDEIYFSLNRLLGSEDVLLIDDDHTRQKWNNYLEIQRKKDHILINVYEKSKERPLYDRFTVFIKNIVPDGRSKIDDFNIKYRISRFFIEAREIIQNDNHQYSFDEYFEILRSQKKYVDKNPYITKNIRKFKNPCESCLTCNAVCDEENKTIDNWCSNYEPVKILNKRME